MSLISGLLGIWAGIAFIICIVVFFGLLFSDTDLIFILLISSAILYWLTFSFFPKYIGLSWSVFLVSSFINCVFVLLISFMKKENK